MPQPAIIVQGGAGSWDLQSKRIQIAQTACRQAAKVGQAVLQAGGSAIAAVETAVRVLEDCPVLDAGRGSYVNKDGEIEMDALLMDGRTLDLGAVAAVQHVRYPISLARRVMTDTEHTFLVGAGASQFADSIGFPRCSTEELKGVVYVGEAAFSEAGPEGDTVGAVAFDAAGDLAAATSTGGTRHKLPGRVGDSPLVGSGAYADNYTAAVSATGQGEALMKIIISKQVCDFVGAGLSPTAACDTAVRLLAERTEGQGGLVAIDHRGRIGFARNTTAMPYAYFDETGNLISGF